MKTIGDTVILVSTIAMSLAFIAVMIGGLVTLAFGILRFWS